jgi:hypothetical protein
VGRPIVAPLPALVLKHPSRRIEPMHVDVREIQPGWEVCDSQGESVGTAVSVEGGHLHIKTGGLLSKDYWVPSTAIDEVEEHRVEISARKNELGAQGWDKAPAEAMTNTSRHD